MGRDRRPRKGRRINYNEAAAALAEDDTDQSNQSSSDNDVKDDVDADDEDDLNDNRVWKRPRTRVKTKTDRRDETEGFTAEEFDEFSKKYNHEWCEQNMAFCCAVCKCNEKLKTDRNLKLAAESEDWELKMQYQEAAKLNADYPYVFPDESDEIWPHRMCCHGVWTKEELEDFVPAFLADQEKLAFAAPDSEELDDFVEEPCPMEWVTLKEIHRAYLTSKNQESATYNAYGEASKQCFAFVSLCLNMQNPVPLIHLVISAAHAVLTTHQDYNKLIEVPFEKLCAKMTDTSLRKKAIVLDAFAGVGTAIVVLKRLGIAIEKIITIEKDKVATYVNKHNHDTSYNADLLPDHKVEHVYIETWEEFEKIQSKRFLKKHGRKF